MILCLACSPGGSSNLGPEGWCYTCHRRVVRDPAVGTYVGTDLLTADEYDAIMDSEVSER